MNKYQEIIPEHLQDPECWYLAGITAMLLNTNDQGEAVISADLFSKANGYPYTANLIALDSVRKGRNRQALYMLRVLVGKHPECAQSRYLFHAIRQKFPDEPGIDPRAVPPADRALFQGIPGAQRRIDEFDAALRGAYLPPLKIIDAKTWKKQQAEQDQRDGSGP